MAYEPSRCGAVTKELRGGPGGEDWSPTYCSVKPQYPCSKPQEKSGLAGPDGGGGGGGGGGGCGSGGGGVPAVSMSIWFTLKYCSSQTSRTRWSPSGRLMLAAVT